MNPDAHPLSASLRGGESGASYEILGKLATGGMAELFLARAPTPNGRPGPVVVLKRILPHLAEDPEFIRMFRDEAYLAATLKHPNIAQVLDIGRQGDDYFFTMEYVHGENLRAILRAAQKRGESIPLTHILTIALGLTASLHHAHEQTDPQGRPLHIVHRDVSPTNVLVAFDGSLKIVDFGIAKAAAGTHVTQAGMLKGKASYMSPEQCRATNVDRRSDVFAIGILLYEMTTLTRLFKGDNELAILHQVLSGSIDAPSTRRPGYPPELERIVLRALAPDPEQRYATAKDLQADLARFGQQNGLRPSTPALGQFLRGLFGNRPLPWQDAPAEPPPNLVAAPTVPTGRTPHEDESDLTVTRDVNAGPPPAPPGPPVPGPPVAARAPRGPATRNPAAKAWRPGGNRRPPVGAPAAPRPPVTPARGRPAAPPPAAPPPAATPPAAPPTTSKQVRLGATPSHAPSRATAPRTAAIPKPPSARIPVPRPRASAPAAARVPAPGSGPAPGSWTAPVSARAPSSAASYAPPPPDYDIDPEESKTAIAGDAYDPMQEAKTRVSGHTADDVRAFLAAAAPANLGSSDGAGHTLAAKTQVTPTSADAVRAFIAAAPPADLVGPSPDPLVARTQIAPATAAELAALAAAAKKAEQRELFSTPAAPTRPGGKLPEPQRSAMTMPAPAKEPPRPNLPAPGDLPPPGGSHAAPRATAPTPAPQDLPPPGGVQAEKIHRRDTVMNAPVQPAALGGSGPHPRAGSTRSRWLLRGPRPRRCSDDPDERERCAPPSGSPDVSSTPRGFGARDAPAGSFAAGPRDGPDSALAERSAAGPVRGAHRADAHGGPGR